MKKVIKITIDADFYTKFVEAVSARLPKDEEGNPTMDVAQHIGNIAMGTLTDIYVSYVRTVQSALYTPPQQQAVSDAIALVAASASVALVDEEE